MHFPRIIVLAALWLCQGCPAASLAAAVDITSILSRQDWSSQTEISIPGEREFANATTRWTEYRAPTYAAALSVASGEDLVTAVIPYDGVLSSSLSTDCP